MRQRLGIAVGFAAGYVLGARAGRERYEELRRLWRGFVSDPRVRQAVHKGREAAQAGASKGLHAVQGGVERAAGSVKSRLEGDGGQPAENG
jgi:hypothetical protein